MRNLTLSQKICLLNFFRLVELICMFVGGVLAITEGFLYIMLTAAGFLFYRQHSKVIQIYKAGRDGEKKAGQLLKGLPSSYMKKHGVHITWDGHSSELDYLVIGPTGVFVIEVKNMSGVIRGSESDQNWTQNKMLKSGKPFVHEFYNPAKQVGTHVYRLSKYLNHELQYDQKIWVQPLVLFVHDDVRLDLHDVRTPVFTQIQPLIHFIQNREVKYHRKQVKEMMRAL